MKLKAIFIWMNHRKRRKVYNDSWRIRNIQFDELQKIAYTIEANIH